VYTSAERQVTIVVSVEPRSVRIRELRWVPIGCRQCQQYAIAGPKVLLAHHGVVLNQTTGGHRSAPSTPVVEEMLRLCRPSRACASGSVAKYASELDNVL
jgi:hypothetical protein